MYTKKFLVLALALTAVVSESAGQQSRSSIQSSSERVARARWQPIRQSVSESIEELPTPAPMNSHSHAEPFADEGVPVEVDGYYADRYREGDYYGVGGGTSCGGCDARGCDGGCDGCGSCNRGRGWNRLFCIYAPTDGWVSAEYLMWWQKGMRLPPLVTTSNVADAGVLGQPSTRTLYGGGDNYVTDELNGLRLRLGFWLDPCHCWGIEAEHFELDTERDSFSASGNGDPVIARPFFNMERNEQDAELVSFPNVVNGTVGVNIASTLEGSGIHLRRQLRCCKGCAPGLCGCLPRAFSSRWEGLFGWRRLQLDERVTISEDLNASDGSARFDIRDQFATRTHFNGFNFGFLYSRRRGCWTLDMAGKFGIGTNRQSVAINGRTVRTTNNVQTFDSGIYALSSNSGSYARDRFAIVPEVSLNAGYYWTSNLRFLLGYNFIYWNNVVRPGDQIDTDLNPSLFPEETAVATADSRPRFRFNEIDYWVQGWNIGAEYRF